MGQFLRKDSFFCVFFGEKKFAVITQPTSFSLRFRGTSTFNPNIVFVVKRNVFFFLFISHNRRREKQMLRKGEAPRDLLIQFPPFSCYCWRFFLSFGFSIINSVEDERARELRVRHDDAPLPIHSPSPRIIFHIIFTSFYTSPRS